MRRSKKSLFIKYRRMPVKKKRVLLIGNFFNESHSMNIYAEELFVNISKLTDSVSLFKPNSKKRRFKLLYKYFYFPFLIIREKDVATYHILDHSYGFLVYFLRLCRPGRFIVVSCHDLTPLYDQDNILSRAKFSSLSYRLWKMAINGMAKANLIIANSLHLKKLIVKYLPVQEKNIQVVYLGVKPSIQNDDLRPYRDRIPYDGFIMLSVGTNEKRKNISTILKVFDEVVRKSPEQKVYLVRVGEALNEEHRKFITDAALTGKVIELGSLGYNALSLLYRQSGCLLFISTDEGFSLTSTEAMNNGLPVVASSVSSLPEVIGDGGILVDPFDVPAATSAVLTIMNDDIATASLKAKAAKRVTQFSWKLCAENVLQTYNNIN